MMPVATRLDAFNKGLRRALVEAELLRESWPAIDTYVLVHPNHKNVARVANSFLEPYAVKNLSVYRTRAEAQRDSQPEERLRLAVRNFRDYIDEVIAHKKSLLSP